MSYRVQTLRIAFALISLALSTPLLRSDTTTTKERTITKLSENIYEIRHPDAPDTFPQGNTTVIIGDQSVLVVDSCLLPSAARQDIEQIRQWTKKPVTYLVNTHWHFDHTLGNQMYAQAFPGIQIIAQKQTQKIIADFNPGAVARYPTREQRFKKILADGKATDGHTLSEDEKHEYEQALAGLAPVIAEMKTTSQLVPNVTFDRELTIDLGNRPVELKFIGRGNTLGDTVVYLPKDKIVLTGDLVDHPAPYLFGGFPVEQVETLKKLTELDAQTIVPGHGDVLHAKIYIHLLIDFLTAVNTAIEKEVNDGKTLEEVQQSIPKSFDLKTWKQKFVGDDTDDGSFFDQTFAGLVKASYNEIKTR
ncbi:MAG TPA: MBL fold metallo-hydrolase [Terriglobales bacterium]|jgi:cyclase|nr:MBL fold metallo-hydrolase [Terriglobales bacterium]